MAEKILLDTDIGSDIDDALCLAYLLAQPECDLLGVTTVSGEAAQRAQIASAIALHMQRDIPIYPGVEQPLFVAQRQPAAQQASRLDRWPSETSFHSGEAVEFLRRTIHAPPGEIRLVVIGPLTNIALLFAIDPTAAMLIKRLVIMGGHYAHWADGVALTEHNIRCDPHAADIVMRSKALIWAVGLGVTHRLRLPADEVRARLGNERYRPVLDFAEVWFQQRDHVTFHDPLAAALIFANGFCTFERGEAPVGLNGERLRGFTHWTHDSAGKHYAGIDVDPGAFFAHFFGVLEGAQTP